MNGNAIVAYTISLEVDYRTAWGRSPMVGKRRCGIRIPFPSVFLAASFIGLGLPFAHATTIVGIRTPEQVVIAADSMGTSRGYRIETTQLVCKIFTVKDAAFAIAGLVKDPVWNFDAENLTAGSLRRQDRLTEYRGRYHEAVDGNARFLPGAPETGEPLSVLQVARRGRRGYYLDSSDGLRGGSARRNRDRFPCIGRAGRSRRDYSDTGSLPGGLSGRRNVFLSRGTATDRPLHRGTGQGSLVAGVFRGPLPGSACHRRGVEARRASHRRGCHRQAGSVLACPEKRMRRRTCPINQRSRRSRNGICRHLQGASVAIVSDEAVLVYAFRAVAGE